MWQGDSVSKSCPFLLDNIEPWKVLAAIVSFGSIPIISFVMRNRLWLFGIEDAISSTHSTGINIEWMSFLHSIIPLSGHKDRDERYANYPTHQRQCQEHRQYGDYLLHFLDSSHFLASSSVYRSISAMQNWKLLGVIAIQGIMLPTFRELRG